LRMFKTKYLYGLPFTGQLFFMRIHAQNASPDRRNYPG
jgi:hypothetical protein